MKEAEIANNIFMICKSVNLLISLKRVGMGVSYSSCQPSDLAQCLEHCRACLTLVGSMNQGDIRTA